MRICKHQGWTADWVNTFCKKDKDFDYMAQCTDEKECFRATKSWYCKSCGWMAPCTTEVPTVIYVLCFQKTIKPICPKCSKLLEIEEAQP